MAQKKNRKQVEREPIQLPPQLLALRRPLLYAFAVLACLGGLVVLSQAWNGWRGERVGPAVAEVANRISADFSAEVAEHRQRLAGLVADAYLRADFSAEAYNAAAERVRAAWPAPTVIEAYSISLAEVYEADLTGFGYTKLQLLNRARESDSPQLSAVGSGARASLGLAAAVRDGERPLGLVFASFPLQPLIDQVRAANLPGGFLQLRNPPALIVESGTSQSGYSTQTHAIEGTGLQLVSGAPVAMALIPYPPWIQALMGLGVIALGAMLVRLLLKAPSLGVAPIKADEPTFLETLAQIPATPAKPGKPTPKPKPKVAVNRSIFRAYDVRGVVGKTLDDGVAKLLGQAIGSMMAEKGLHEIVVGRDGRHSGPALSDALIEGLRLAGRDVIDIGQAPTPIVYFATYQLNTGSGVAVTGSHNPPDYNGFKIVVGGETLSGEAIQALYARIAENRLDDGGGGGLQVMDVSEDYLSRIAGDVQLERRVKVVVDCGNGVAGAIAPAVLEAIGCEVEPLFCEVDGNFPNHHPDPSDLANLSDLILMVKRVGADIGLAFDGDGDRLGVVTAAGEVIYPDRLLMLFAQDVLSRNPGATIIYDVKCTGHLAGQILRNGGSPIMWKTGHSLIKAKMRETEAELAGEMSGHFFFRERWFGFDDGIYSAARLLEILAADERTPDEIFAELPKGVSTPELKIPMEEGDHYSYMERFRTQAKFEGAKIATIDGIRADWPDGWGLVRCSNTTPCLVLRFDADNDAALKRIQALFRQQLLALDPALKLPF